MTDGHERTTRGCKMQCLEDESGRTALVCLICTSGWTLVGVFAVTLLGCFLALCMPPMLRPALQAGSFPQPAAWVQRHFQAHSSWVRLREHTLW